MLEDLAAKAQKLTLEISVDKVDEETIKELENILSNNQGKTNLWFNLVDYSSDTRIEMFSRNRNVTLTQELKSYLQKHPAINFSIN